MRQFLLRLLGVNHVEKECPACAVYRKWNEDLQGELEVLHAQLEDQLNRTVGEKNVERIDRKELENVILEFTRLKRTAPPETKVVVSPPSPTQATNIRPGSRWPTIRNELEEKARKKAEYYRGLQNDEIRSGRLDPNAPEDIRELEKNLEQGKQRGAQ